MRVKVLKSVQRATLRCSDDLWCPRESQGRARWDRPYAGIGSIYFPASFLQFSTEKEADEISQTHGVKVSVTPVQRGTGKQTELQAENMREFQEEEFEKQKCDYKEKSVRVN